MTTLYVHYLYAHEPLTPSYMEKTLPRVWSGDGILASTVYGPAPHEYTCRLARGGEINDIRFLWSRTIEDLAWRYNAVHGDDARHVGYIRPDPDMRHVLWAYHVIKTCLPESAPVYVAVNPRVACDYVAIPKAALLRNERSPNSLFNPSEEAQVLARVLAPHVPLLQAYINSLPRKWGAVFE